MAGAGRFRNGAVMLKEERETRDLFAVAALIGLIASHDRGGPGRLFDTHTYAEDAYAFADSMMKQREASES